MCKEFRELVNELNELSCSVSKLIALCIHTKYVVNQGEIGKVG